MTTTFPRLLLLGASAAVLSACATIDLDSLPQPKYATRIEDVLPAPAAPSPATPSPAAAQPPAEAVEAEASPVRAAPSGKVSSQALPPVAAAADEDTPPPPPPPSKAKPVAVERVSTGPGAPRPATTAGGLRYTVQPGDTLSGVGRRFAVPVQKLIEINGLNAQGSVRAGQKLVLPPEAKDRGTDPYAAGPTSGEPVRVAETAAPVRSEPVRPRDPLPAPSEPAPSRVAEAASAATKPATPTTKPARPSAATERATAQTPTQAPTRAPTPAAPPIVDSAPPADPAAVASLARGRFIWPVKGEILSRYGALGQGLRNDGVNIAAAAGTAVKASDAGEVVYAGDSVPGFGNLVLIKHADGWVTAYGHLGRIDVKMRQQVARGATIGQVGQTGGVDRPQLHFEMRYASSPMEKARPLDPLPLLQ